MVGYGGNVTLGSPGVVGVAAVVKAIVLAVGAAVVAAALFTADSTGALEVSACTLSTAATVSTAGVAVCSVGAVDDFGLASVSVAEVAVPEPVSISLAGVVGAMVGSVGVCDDVVLSFETVVPEPPEALTDEVGPSPDVVDVVCEPDDGVALDSVSVVVAPDAPEVPEVVVSDSVEVVGFDPASESVEPDG